MIGHLFTSIEWNEIAKLNNNWWFNCSYELILSIDSLVTPRCPRHGIEAKMFSHMAQNLMMKELDVHIGGNTVWVSHEKVKFWKITECSHIIWLDAVHHLKMLVLINRLAINIKQKMISLHLKITLKRM